MTDSVATTGIVLAGGQGSRLGNRDKGWIPWRKSTLIEQVVTRLQGQVDGLVISCNRNAQRYQTLGYPVCADTPGLRYQGPLAGLSAALSLCPPGHVVLVPCDAPLLPQDLVSRLLRTLRATQADICYAHDGEREQYLFAIMETRLRDSLQDYLQKGGRSVKGWYALHRTQAVDFADQAASFVNINHQADLAKPE